MKKVRNTGYNQKAYLSRKSTKKRKNKDNVVLRTVRMSEVVSEVM